MTQTPHNPLQDGYPNPDTFNLKSRGDQLSNALANMQEPTVLAVDGPWGSGKSYFLQCFKGACSAGTHQNLQGAHVVYVDAFREDYLDQPLMSLMQAIVKEVEPNLGNAAKKTIVPKLKQGAVLAGKIGLNWATRGAADQVLALFATDEDGDGQADPNNLTKALSGGLNDLSDKTREALDSMWQVSAGQRNTMKVLRDTLKALVDASEKKRLIIIVDELDRCRPDYALRLLEVMKHVFDVDGCHFVLGVNQSELAHSVLAIYGQGFDGEKYLQRFVQVVMGWNVYVPNTSENGSHEWAKVFLRGMVVKDNEKSKIEILCKSFNYINQEVQITYRDLQRIYNIWMLTYRECEAFDRKLFACLLIVYVCKPELFKRVVERENSVKGLFLKCFELNSDYPGDSTCEEKHFYQYLLCHFDEVPQTEDFQNSYDPHLFARGQRNVISSHISRLTIFNVY